MLPSICRCVLTRVMWPSGGNQSKESCLFHFFAITKEVRAMRESINCIPINKWVPVFSCFGRGKRSTSRLYVGHLFFISISGVTCFLKRLAWNYIVLGIELNKMLRLPKEGEGANGQLWLAITRGYHIVIDLTTSSCRGSLVGVPRR